MAETESILDQRIADLSAKYLVTQMVAHLCREGFDRLIYTNVLDGAGRNIVFGRFSDLRKIVASSAKGKRSTASGFRMASPRLMNGVPFELGATCSISN